MSTRYVAALGSLLLVALAVPSQAQIPRLLPYQGVLNDSSDSQPNYDPIKADAPG